MPKAQVAVTLDTLTLQHVDLVASMGFVVRLGSASRLTISDMGTFRTDVEIENPAFPGERTTFRNVLVDTGAELCRFPAEALTSLGIQRRKEGHFRQADGTVFRRWTGGVSVHVGALWTMDEVVFGEPGDLTLLGARSLEGLNLRVDPVKKMLVDAGPAPAATAA